MKHPTDYQLEWQQGKYASIAELAQAIQEDALVRASEIAYQQFVSGFEDQTKAAILAELARIQSK